MRRLFQRHLAASALMLVAAACAPAAPVDLDPLAEDYVHLILEIGAHEEGYVDAYTGPAEWKTEAEANPRAIADLKIAADELVEALGAAAKTETDPLLTRRVAFIAAHTRSARFRLDMIEGVRLPFRDEAERLFGVRPEIAPLTSFDATLAQLEAVAPGDGPLASRVEAFLTRYQIPPHRLDDVMTDGIAECRRRTLAHLTLPEGESFRLEFVTDKAWGGYNYFQGEAHSLIQINIDHPIMIDRVIDLGCHEGYPGHHTHQTLLESDLVKGRGWIEFTVFPLYSPLGFIAEGAGNAGVDLAYPGDEQERYVTEILFPLAGVNPATAPAYFAFNRARAALSGADVTIAQMYLDGEVDRDAAIALMQRYMLRSATRAEQQLRFIDTYRSYILNYHTGQDMVRAHVEAAGADQAARWEAFRRVIAEPTLPVDLSP